MYLPARRRKRDELSHARTQTLTAQRARLTAAWLACVPLTCGSARRRDEHEALIAGSPRNILICRAG
jgi:hypothetical protein